MEGEEPSDGAGESGAPDSALIHDLRDPDSTQQRSSPLTQEAGPDGPEARELVDLLQVVPSDTARFLTVEGRMEYGAITYVLFWNRLYAKNEVAHDALRDEVDALLAATGRAIDEEKFQTLLDQLAAWGIIDKQYSARGIQSVREWRRQPYYYWITEDAFRLFRLLEHGKGLQESRPFGGVGKDYLSTILEHLENIASSLEELESTTEEGARDEEVQRLYRDLVRLTGDELGQFKNFLATLKGYLIEFGRLPKVDFEQLEEVREWLHAYVEDMLVYFRDRSSKIHERARLVAHRHEATLEKGRRLEMEAAANPFDPPTEASHPPARTLLRPLLTFFEPRGGLDEQANRIRESTSQTIHRLEEHYQRLAETSYITQLLNQRIDEIRVLDSSDDQAMARLEGWMNRLVAPQFVPFAPRIGTPDSKGAPPRPRRRYEYSRPEVRDCVAEEPEGGPADPEADHRALADQINSFVEDRILKGREEAELDGVTLRNLREFQVLLQAVKNDDRFLRAPVSKHFTFTVADPRGRPTDPLQIIDWTTEDAVYTGPNLTFRRRRPRASLRSSGPFGGGDAG